LPDRWRSDPLSRLRTRGSTFFYFTFGRMVRGPFTIPPDFESTDSNKAFSPIRSPTLSPTREREESLHLKVSPVLSNQSGGSFSFGCCSSGLPGPNCRSSPPSPALSSDRPPVGSGDFRDAQRLRPLVGVRGVRCGDLSCRRTRRCPHRTPPLRPRRQSDTQKTSHGDGAQAPTRPHRMYLAFPALVLMFCFQYDVRLEVLFWTNEHTEILCDR